jgi:hypothetical protein
VVDHGIFDPAEILRALAAHDVDFVVIGGIAAALHGTDHVTTDVDIAPSTAADNLGRLSAALDDLGARIRVEGIAGGLAFDHDGPSLAGAGVWNLTTRAGDLDIAFHPAGTGGWDDLRPRALVVDLGGAATPVASLRDVIRSKEAADRPKDRVALPALRAALAIQERERGGGG